MGKQIFVLGMHRSGTSVVTHLIHRMGAYFGDIDQEMRPSDENPKGFWERNDVVRINEAILNSDKSNWFKISNFDVERCRISPDLEQAIESTISSLDKYTPWVVKDPRNCLTFPVWRKYLSAPVVVIPFRSPLEVAKSLQGRNSFPVEFSLALWQSYVVAAIRSAADLPVIFVEYEKMIKSPIQETHTLYRKLVENGVENLELPSDLIIQDIIDPTLKHAAVSHEKEQLDQDKLNLIEGLREKDIDRLHRLVESISENNFRVLQNWEEKISEIFERTISKKNRITSTLFYSIEGEFSLKNSIRITQSTDEINKRLKFTIAPSFQPGQQIKVDLVDDICILQLTSISISGDGHTPIKEGAISSNAFYRMGEYFYFDQVPSSIYFSLPDDLDISSGNIEILINFELIGKGVTIIPHINQFHRNFVAYGEKTDDTGIDKIQELVQALTSQKDRALTKSQILLDYSKSSNQNLTENIQCLQEQNSAQLNLLDQLTAKLEKKEKEAEAFSKTSSELSKKLRIEKEARAELKNKYESVLSEKESQAGEIDQLSTLKVEHKSLIVQLEQELNDLKEEKQSTVVQLKREVDDLREEKQSLVVQLEQDVNNLRAEKQSAVAQLEQELAIIKDSLSNQLGRLLTFPVRIIFDVLTRKKPFNQTQLWWIKQHLTHPKAIIGSREKRQALRADWSLQRRATANNLSFSATTAEILSELDIEHDSSPDHTPVVPLMALNAKNKDNFRYRKKILYISPNLPDFDTSSGGKRATRMLELLAEVFDVYAFTLGSKPQKYIDELQRKGVIVLRTGDHREVRRKLPQIDTIIYAWYETYFSSTIFQHLYPNAKIIVDSVDVHWVREKRSIGLWEGLTEERVIANKKREIEAYRNADIIWAVTETDKAAIAAELPGTDIRVVSNIHEPMVHEYVDNHKHTLLFIGGYNHYPNVSAAKILAEQIFPKVQQSVQDATLIIAGANAPGEIEALSQIPGITFKGFIEEDEIKDLYAQSFLTVSPLLVGAGIKGKICESIAYMTPVVTNDIGNEGIYLIHEREGLISPVDQMSEWIIKALNREFDFEKITMGAQQKLSGLVGSKVVKERMVNSIVPEISICIVTWNRRDLVQRCIESIEGNTLYPNYKILVHSNGCADGTQDYLKAAAKINPKIIPILSEKNDVFVLPNNRMMEMYPENDVVLVNNDVYVTKGWLSALHDTAYSSADYGIVGSKILYPDGRLQEFGSELYANGTGRNIGKFDDPNKREYKQLAEVGYVSGCSMFIKRSTIKKIGVFDEQFHPCYCEDSDYCYTAKENGIKTVVTPKSIIFHDEGGTSGTDTSSGMKRYQVINMEKFLKKHMGRPNGIIWPGHQLTTNKDLPLEKSEPVIESVSYKDVKINFVDSYEGYRSYAHAMENEYENRLEIERKIADSKEDVFQVEGYNVMADTQEQVKFKVAKSKKGSINYRESFICEKSRLNSRLRATHVILEYLMNKDEKLHSDSPIYFTEQSTTFYSLYQKKFKNLVGSEYLGEQQIPGFVNEKGIRHEDLTNLSFADNSFDLIVSLEVLEHIPDFDTAIQEVNRVLKPGGYFVFTVPFILSKYETTVRAQINSTGEIEHLLSPEYHGDPVQENGILCFYHFGWDLIEEHLAENGIECQAAFLWSEEYCIFGKDLCIFVGHKKYS